MKKIIKNNLLGIIIGVVLAGGIGTVLALTSTQITYTNNGQTTVEGALDDLYTKANNVSCKKGYEKVNEKVSGYNCLNPLLFKPTYYSYGEVTTASPTSPPSNDTFLAMDASGNKAVCLRKNGEINCFQYQPDNQDIMEFERQHIQDVFSDDGSSCEISEISVNCKENKSFGFYCFLSKSQLFCDNYAISCLIEKNGAYCG